ncbi:MAG TPA: beta-N-acetylhexosaminidase, partial [Luteolibacter sp.]
MSIRPIPSVLITLLSSLSLSLAGNPEPLPALIPRPASITQGKGQFQLRATTSLQTAKAEEIAAAEWLAEQLRKPTGYALPVKANAAPQSLGFFLDDSLKDALGAEGYRLETTAESVKIQAASAAGLFYGAQSFRQLLPAQAFGHKKATDVTWAVPAVKIEDRPRFAWRGFMIDTSRHFFPIEFLKQLIDDMASQKLNLLQIHLTDDDGWRVEIKKYPKLTEIGAWRGTECALPNTREGETFKRYGGFYTQEQLEELVAYAKQRHVEIMPEVDLPGHALAIATAYPETLPEKLSDAVSVQGYKANAISPARETNYT